MCGIVGYVGKRPVQDLLLAGLTRLEYRGYDSAGISMIAGDAIDSVRAVGNLEHLRDAVSARAATTSPAASPPPPARPPPASATPAGPRTGASTRRTPTRTSTRPTASTSWSTASWRTTSAHARAPERHGRGLHQRDRRRGHRPSDRPPLAPGSLMEAVRAAYNELEGHFAFVAMRLDEPETLVGARKECPLIVGRGDGETFFACAIPAFLRETRRVQYIENGEIVDDHGPRARRSYCPTAPSSSARSWRSTGTRRPPRRAASRRSCSRRSTSRPTRWPRRSPTAPCARDGVDLDDVGALDEDVPARRQAHHRRRLRHELPRGPHRPLRDRGVGAHPGRDGHRLRVPLPQPGRRPGRPGHRHHAVGRDGRHAGGDAHRPRARRHRAGADQHHGLAGHARRRRRALHARRPRGRRGGDEDVRLPGRGDVPARPASSPSCAARCRAERRAEIIADLKRIPHCIEELLGNVDEQVAAIADAHWDKDFFLYLGRHVGLPVALEGALKLKEISYISTDAYAAGEMKHGPIALLDESTPVVTVATDSPVLEKVVSNMQEVRARGAHVIAIATEGNADIGEHAESVVRIPRHRLDAAAAARRHPAAAAGLPRSRAGAGSTSTSRATWPRPSRSSSDRQHVGARAEQARLGLHAADGVGCSRSPHGGRLIVRATPSRACVSAAAPEASGAFGCVRRGGEGLLDVEGDGVDEVHLVALGGERQRVGSGRAADVEDGGGRAREAGSAPAARACAGTRAVPSPRQAALLGAAVVVAAHVGHGPRG